MISISPRDQVLQQNDLDAKGPLVGPAETRRWLSLSRSDHPYLDGYPILPHAVEWPLFVSYLTPVPQKCCKTGT